VLYSFNLAHDEANCFGNIYSSLQWFPTKSLRHHSRGCKKRPSYWQENDLYIALLRLFACFCNGL